MNHYHSRQVSVKVNQELLKSADALAYAPYIETILRHAETQRLPTLYVDARQASAFRPGMDSAESAGLHCGG